MMEYYKINSLWKREGWYFEEGKKNSPEYQKGRQSFIIGDFAVPEFACIKNWRITEKIDGTNIRIEYSYRENIDSDDLDIEELYIKGRTDNAQIPPHLLQYLQKIFTEEKLRTLFPNAQRITLFGEGYGHKIQEPCGSLYASEPGFVLFDVIIGKWALKFEDVKGIATSLGVPCVPDLGIMTTEQIYEYVVSQPKSIFSKKEQVMEGIVATSEPLMLFTNGHPIKMKLKCKEFTYA